MTTRPHRSRLILPDDPIVGDRLSGLSSDAASAQTNGASNKHDGVGPARWAQLGALAVVITAALMVGGSAAWQLWGSDLWGRIAQRQASAVLEDETENPALVLPAGMSLAALASSPATAAPPTSAVAAPSSLPGIPQVSAGAPFGRILAPTAGVDAALVGGTTRSDLKTGPGWMFGTAFPGMPGNSVISGHRTTYGGPFRHLDRLAPGDRVTVEVPQFGTTVFEVRAVFVVKPNDVWVATPTDGVRLTLTTCHPKGSDRQRLIVQAEAVEGPAAHLAVPADGWGPSTPG